MSRPHGHVRVNSRSPLAAGICDRCSQAYNHADLRFQFDFRGELLMNTRILVCRSCYDKPQEQLRARILTPDPVPIYNARPEPFAVVNAISYDGTDYLTLPDGTFMAMPDGSTLMVDANNDPRGP